MGFEQLWQAPLQPDLDNPKGTTYVPVGFNRPSRLADPITPGTHCKLVIRPVAQDSLKNVQAWVTIGDKLHLQQLKEPVYEDDGYRWKFIAGGDYSYDDVTAFQLVVTFDEESRPKHIPQAKLFIQDDLSD